MKEVVTPEDQDFMNDKYFRICDELLRLEVVRGHLNWSVSEVARASEVTRSLIYYYFGKSKEELLEEASRHMIHTIYGNSDNAHLGVENRCKKVVGFLRKNPNLFVYWYKNRGKDNSVGRLIEEKEERAFKVIKSYYPDLPETEIFKIQALQISAVAMQWDDETIERVFGQY